MYRKGFKYNKTIIVSSFIFILGFLTINLLHFDADMKLFREKLFDSLLPSSAEMVTAYLDSYNSKYSLLSRAIASDIDPYSFYIDGREDADLVIRKLRKIRDISGVKTAGYVSLLTDRYYDSSGTVVELDYGSERDRWVSDFLKSGKETKSTFYDPDDSRELFAIYNDVLIHDDSGKSAAVFGIGISFDSADRNIKNTGSNKTVFFADTSGAILFPETARGENVYNRYAIDRSKHNIADDNETQYEKLVYLPEEERHVVFYSEYLPLQDKVLIIEVDLSGIYSDIRNQFVSSFLAGLVLSVAIVAGNIIILNYSNSSHYKRACKDPLTGTYNRRYLDYCLSDRRNSFSNGKISLITLDIDYFKVINDTKGHLKGDEILKTVSEVAQSCLRDNDTVIRWGGDEFVLLVNAGIEDACMIAERIRAELVAEKGVSITAGVTFLEKGEEFETALERADSALYRAKNEGRNRVYSA